MSMSSTSVSLGMCREVWTKGWRLQVSGTGAADFVDISMFHFLVCVSVCVCVWVRVGPGLLFLFVLFLVTDAPSVPTRRGFLFRQTTHSTLFLLLITRGPSGHPRSSFIPFAPSRRRPTRTHQLSPPIRAIHLGDIFRVRRYTMREAAKEKKREESQLILIWMTS